MAKDLELKLTRREAVVLTHLIDGGGDLRPEGQQDFTSLGDLQKRLDALTLAARRGKLTLTFTMQEGIALEHVLSGSDEDLHDPDIMYDLIYRVRALIGKKAEDWT
jgi:hypothetical protein